MVAALVALPWVGACLVRTVALPRLEARLGVRVEAEAIQVRPTRLVLHRFRLRTPAAGNPDLLTAARLQVHYRALPLLGGRLRVSSVRLERARLHLTDEEEGAHPLHKLTDLLRRKPTGDARPDANLDGPERLEIADLSVEIQGPWGTISSAVSGVVERGRPAELRLSDLSADLGAASARAARLVVRVPLLPGRFRPAGLPEINVEGGEVAPWKGLALTGIRGTLRPDPDQPGRAALALRGGYGGVDRDLWDASGWVSPGTGTKAAAALRLQAARFRLSSLDPILKDTPLIDTAETEIDANLDLRYANEALDFDGVLRVAGLSIFTPRLAAEPVRGLALHLTARGRIEPRTRRYRLHEAVLRWRGAEAILEIDAEAQPAHLRRTHQTGAGGSQGGEPGWRERWRTVSMRLRIPPIPCQAALQAIPPELVPRLQGFQLKGIFSTDLQVHVDFAQLLKLPSPTDEEEEEAMGPVRPEPPQRSRRAQRPVPPLRGPDGRPAPLPGPVAPVDRDARDRDAKKGPQAVTLSGKVGIDGCQVVEPAPEMSYERMLEDFEHTVEVEPNKVISFIIGPEDPDFVPYEEISPYLINSIMTTEDNGFMRHRGFIGPEFRSALEQNLQRGYFRLGASSITMQMVKNVLLSREKTLSRKLQELFLTWYLEQHLTKERILEIYFNAIEFGPYLYGIGRAARHYFGKTAKELTPREAAWFSSILPNPKKRYVHFCKGRPDPKWEAYLNRILRRVHERGRLTDEEFAASQQERLVFNRAEALPEKECLALIKRLTEPPPAPAP